MRWLSKYADTIQFGIVLCKHISSVYSEHCTPYIVHCTLYTVYCIMYTVHYRIYAEHGVMNIAILYIHKVVSGQWSLHDVQCNAMHLEWVSCLGTHGA